MLKLKRFLSLNASTSIFHAAFPFLRWILPRGKQREDPAAHTHAPIPRYNWTSHLLADTIAGLTCAFTVVPQGMAYATLAGLPPLHGLYTSFIPPLIYFFFGSSPHLVVGPTAILSLMISTGYHALSSSSSSTHSSISIQEYAGAVTFLSAIFSALLGLCRLGFLSQFISHPVISGFTAGAALLIAGSQLGSLCGISMKGVNTNSFVDILVAVFTHIEQTNWRTALLGLCCVLFLTILRNLPRVLSAKKLSYIPGPLIVVVLGTVLSYGLHLTRYDVKVVGHVPSGLPPFTPPFSAMHMSNIGTLCARAAAISLIGFMESFSIAKTFAIQQRYKVSVARELWALGVSNIFGGMFTCYAATGSFSRTAVNVRVGARSHLANLIASLVVMLSILLLTPLFHYLPQAVLAAIVISAVVTVIDVHEPLLLFKCRCYSDFLVFFTAFVVTITLGVEWGIGLSILLSLLILLYRNTYVNLSIGQLDSTPQEKLGTSSTLCCRLNGPLYFINVASFEEKIREILLSGNSKEASLALTEEVDAVDERETEKLLPAALHQVVNYSSREMVEALVVDVSLCEDMDGTAIQAVRSLKQELRAAKVELCFERYSVQLQRKLYAAELLTSGRKLPGNVSIPRPLMSGSTDQLSSRLEFTAQSNSESLQV